MSEQPKLARDLGLLSGLTVANSALKVAEGLAQDADGLSDQWRAQYIRDQAHGWAKFAEFLMEGGRSDADERPEV